MYKEKIKRLQQRTGVGDDSLLVKKLRERGAEVIRQVELNPQGYLNRIAQAIGIGIAECGPGFLISAVALTQFDDPKIRGTSGENALYFLGAVGVAAALKGMYDITSNAACLRDICLYYVTREKEGNGK